VEFQLNCLQLVGHILDSCGINPVNTDEMKISPRAVVCAHVPSSLKIFSVDAPLFFDLIVFINSI
jgi:hypothetical protein